MSKHMHNHSTSGGLWIAGWLFTLGLLGLPFGKAVLAIVIWPFYLGVFLAV